MSSIFICYRREDAAGHAGRLFDGLTKHFGKDRIFMDVSGSIEAGTDFVEAIERAVGSCDVLLAVIGRRWLDCTDADGRRRLDEPGDFIRLETASALARKIRVVPVLVDGARMPRAEDLPADLKPLARRQAIELSDPRWDFDVAKLVAALERARAPKTTSPKVTAPITTAREAEGKPRTTGFPRWLLAAVATAVIGLGLWLSWPDPPNGREVVRLVGLEFLGPDDHALGPSGEILGGDACTLVIALSDGAPEGLEVGLAAHGGLIDLPPAIPVPAGRPEVEIEFPTPEVDGRETAGIEAWLGESRLVAELALLPRWDEHPVHILSLAFLTDDGPVHELEVDGRGDYAMEVRLSRPVPGESGVWLRALGAGAELLEIPDSVWVASGEDRAWFGVALSKVPQEPIHLEIKAGLGESSVSAELHVIGQH